VQRYKTRKLGQLLLLKRLRGLMPVSASYPPNFSHYRSNKRRLLRASFVLRRILVNSIHGRLFACNEKDQSVEIRDAKLQ